MRVAKKYREWQDAGIKDYLDFGREAMLMRGKRLEKLRADCAYRWKFQRERAEMAYVSGLSIAFCDSGRN